MVIWFTGISGTGKTTLGKKFFIFLKKKHPSTIFLDGDEFRKIFKNDIKYTLEDRDKNASRLTNLIKYLSRQKINIVVAANITNPKFRIWCRKHINNYFEIYISANRKNLLKRDYKKLYKNITIGKIKNVVGVDLPFKRPVNSDLYIDNNATKFKFLENINLINRSLKKSKIKIY